MMTTIERDGVRVDVCRRTPRTEMYYRALLRRMVDLYEDIASDIGFPVNAVDDALADYAIMASRSTVVDGELDFMFPSAIDDSDTIREQFLEYIETDYMAVVDAIKFAIRQMDAPANPVTAPTPLPDSAPEKKDDSGNAGKKAS